eukprot:g11780.t1
MMAGLGDAVAEAAGLAVKIGAAAADTFELVADLGEELPLVQPVLKTLRAINEKVETAKSNSEELAVLHQRCAYTTACFIVKCRRDASELDVTPLEDCIKTVEKVVGRCGHRGIVSRVLKASSDKDEILRLKERIRDLEGDLSLAGIAVLERMGKSQATKQRDILANQEIILGRLPQPPTKLASVPKGTPARKSWHVQRGQVMETVFELLAGNQESRLVGLVGGSGSGKTTVASEIVRNVRVREAFCDGIVWLTIGEGAEGRLQSLMIHLARTVHKDIGGSVGRCPAVAEDGVAYVKQWIERGRGGKPFKCLLVADNVWEKEVVSKLLETGMWVLLSTRDEEVVSRAHGEAVSVNELSEADAESVLRRAAELSPEVRLPDDAVDLIDLCGRVAMDLAFVGRWSTVRGRQDRGAWADAASKVRAEIDKTDSEGSGGDTAGFGDGRANRRKAILRAGFEDLAIGSDDERVQRLYLSLAVLPDGEAFSVKDAAVLLYDRTPTAEDEASVAGVVEILERWTILQSEGGIYRMHDAHSGFARENLMDRGYVRRPAVERLVKSVSSLEALRSADRFALKRVWLAVERVGGDGWAKARPYAKALDAMDGSNSLLLRQSIEAVAWFQEAQEDWAAATTTWRRLLAVEKKDLGADHPYVLNTYRSLASCANHLGNGQEAAGWLRQEQEALPLALARVQSKVDGSGTGGLDDAVCLASLATTVLKCKPDGRDEIETLLRRSLEIKEAKLGSEDVQVAVALHDLGVCIRQAGRLDEAEGVLARCLEIRKAKLGDENAQVAGALHDLGVCVREAGRLEEAEALLGRSLEIKEAKLGPCDAEVAITLYELGVCVRGARRLGEAEELLRRCLGIVEVKLGRESAGVANTLSVLVLCVREAGRLEEAAALLRRCLKIKEANLDPDHAQVATTLHDLGVCVRETGRLEEAERLLGRCLEIKESRRGPEDVEVARTLFELGECAIQAGRLEDAEGLLRRCLGIVEAKLGPKNVGVANILKRLAMCARKAGRLEEAEELSGRSRASN